MYKEKILDVLTGEITYRDYTAEEIAEVEKAQAESAKQLAEQQAREAKKATALAKLVALGLTTDDLKALGL